MKGFNITGSGSDKPATGGAQHRLNYCGIKSDMVVASARTSLPVPDGGTDALYSIVQMPAGLPAGALKADKAIAKKAAILTARTIALSNKNVAERAEAFTQNGYRV